MIDSGPEKNENMLNKKQINFPKSSHHFEWRTPFPGFEQDKWYAMGVNMLGWNDMKTGLDFRSLVKREQMTSYSGFVSFDGKNFYDQIVVTVKLSVKRFVKWIMNYTNVDCLSIPLTGVRLLAVHFTALIPKFATGLTMPWQICPIFTQQS